MRVIPPLTILDAMFSASTAAEPWAPSAYVAGTTYAAGDIISVAADFKIYESLADGNTGNTPNVSPTWWVSRGPTETAYDAGKTDYALGATVSSSTTHRVYESLVLQSAAHPLPVLPATTTAYWLDVGPTNKWAMFDTYRNTKSVGASPLIVSIAPGKRIKSVAFLGLEATSVTVTMDSALGSPSARHYSHTEDLGERKTVVDDWYEYFFAEFGSREAFALFDLPLYAGDTLTATITNTGGPAACGAMVIGSHQYLGETEHSAVSDATNYSVIDRDAFGNVTLVPRRSIPKVDITVIADKVAVRDIYNLRSSLNAVPAVYTSVDDSTDGYFEALLILGIYRLWGINAVDPTFAEVTLSIEEI